MHATERERLILDMMSEPGFVTYRALEANIDASPATIRRDLSRLEEAGQIARVRGGAKLRPDAEGRPAMSPGRLVGTPFQDNLNRRRPQKEAIGRAAAALCQPGEGIMIDGGTTTFQMCPYLAGLNLQVLTNSLHIVSALLSQSGTRLLVPSGAVFPEQNIILSPEGDESMPRFHAPKLFMGAASVGTSGIMQADVLLVAAERRLMEKADQVIVLADSSKFQRSSGTVVCGLEDIDILITDSGITDEDARSVRAADVELIVV
jgi:DeoR family ulaG and ulaABCDEF operon transcriptional repressor